MPGPATQLVDRKLEPGQGPNASYERNFIDGFGEEVVGAGFETADAVGGLVERGYKNDRQMRGLRPGSQTSTNFKTVHAGHHYIEKNNIAAARSQIAIASRPFVAVSTSKYSMLSLVSSSLRLGWTSSTTRMRAVTAWLPAQESDRWSQKTWRLISAWTGRLRSRPAGFFPRRLSWQKP